MRTPGSIQHHRSGTPVGHKKRGTVYTESGRLRLVNPDNVLLTDGDVVILCLSDDRDVSIVCPCPAHASEKSVAAVREFGRAELQNASNVELENNCVLVIYQAEDGKLWAREEREFQDGRFEEITSPFKKT